MLARHKRDRDPSKGCSRTGWDGHGRVCRDTLSVHATKLSDGGGSGLARAGECASLLLRSSEFAIGGVPTGLVRAGARLISRERAVALLHTYFHARMRRAGARVLALRVGRTPSTALLATDRNWTPTAQPRHHPPPLQRCSQSSSFEGAGAADDRRLGASVPSSAPKRCSRSWKERTKRRPARQSQEPSSVQRHIVLPRQKEVIRAQRHTPG